MHHLLEITQYICIYLFAGMFGGIALESVFPKETAESSKRLMVWQLYLHFLARLTLQAIYMYYTYKMVSLIPFLFCLTSSYIPGLKGEPMFGAAVIFTYALTRAQPTQSVLYSEMVRRLTR